MSEKMKVGSSEGGGDRRDMKHHDGPEGTAQGKRRRATVGDDGRGEPAAARGGPRRSPYETSRRATSTVTATAGAGTAWRRAAEARGETIGGIGDAARPACAEEGDAGIAAAGT